MIQDLNEKNLTKLGFNAEQIKECLESGTHENVTNPKKSFYIDIEERQIYTESDVHARIIRKQNFKHFPINSPKLIHEYFDTHLRPFLEKKESLLGDKIFNKEEQTQVFIDRQIKDTEERIQSLQTFIDANTNANHKREWTSKIEAIETYQVYLSFLEKGVNCLEQKSNLPKWFPIGLGFATGDIQKKIKTISARNIVKEYNLDGSSNYVSLTYSNTTKDPKNIYSDFDKLNLIYNYCTENNVKICEDFTTAYNKKEKELN